MSVFSPDIINREIDYRPDPRENTRFQINRQFERICDAYAPSTTTDIQTFLKDSMTNVMYEMESSFYTGIPPEWWKGEFMYITAWRVIRIDLCDGRTGVQIMWKYTNEIHYMSMDLTVDITGMVNKYKNWVL